ncbi:hypothetical protein Tco_1185817 [Tanacetum coccineum]
MITTPKSSPSKITSSPSLSPQTYQSPLRDITRQDTEIPQSQFPTQTQIADKAAFTSVVVDARGAATTEIGLEAFEVFNGMDMQQTKKVYSSALTKLILREKKLEKKVKTNKARRRARIVILEDEDAEEDSSKQGRKISKIDKDPTISLVQPEQDMEYDFYVSTAEGFTTASVPVTTASATLEGGYKQSHFKGMSYEDIRPIFKRVWDQNNAFVPKDSVGNFELLLPANKSSDEMITANDFAMMVQENEGYNAIRLLLEKKSLKHSATRESFQVHQELLMIAGRIIHSIPTCRSFPLNVNDLPDDRLMPDLEDTAEVQNTGIFGSVFDDEDLDTYNSPFAD